MTEEKSSIEDLFSEEDIPFDIETEPLNESSKKRKSKSKLVPMVGIAVVLVGLLYLAYANNNRFYLNTNGGMVSVEQGLFFPVGRMKYQPNVAYQPFKLSAESVNIPTDALTAKHRDELLVGLLIKAATERLNGPGNDSLEEGMAIFRRAYKLETVDVTQEQRNQFMGQFNMKKMYSTISQIHGLLKNARANADDASRQGAKNAKEWLSVIEKALSELDALATKDKIKLDSSTPKTVKQSNPEAQPELTE